MFRPACNLLTLAVVLTGVACAPAMSSDPDRALGRSSNRSTLITWEEMRERGQSSSIYDLIQELRPRWLRPQGPDTFLGLPGQVQAHIDGNRLGNVQALRRLTAHGVTSIRWMPPIDASARFGLGHSHGAVIISTAPIH